MFIYLDKGLLPEAIQGYVLSFFGCRECRNHFKKELKKIPFQITDSDYDAILWLWKIHNEVNKRFVGVIMVRFFLISIKITKFLDNEVLSSSFVSYIIRLNIAKQNLQLC